MVEIGRACGLFPVCLDKQSKLSAKWFDGGGNILKLPGMNTDERLYCGNTLFPCQSPIVAIFLSIKYIFIRCHLIICWDS